MDTARGRMDVAGGQSIARWSRRSHEAAAAVVVVRRKRLGSFVENYSRASELSEAGAGEERLKWVRRGSRVAAVEAVVDPSCWGWAGRAGGANLGGEMRQRKKRRRPPRKGRALRG